MYFFIADTLNYCCLPLPTCTWELLYFIKIRTKDWGFKWIIYLKIPKAWDKLIQLLMSYLITAVRQNKICISISSKTEREKEKLQKDWCDFRDNVDSDLHVKLSKTDNLYHFIWFFRFKILFWLLSAWQLWPLCFQNKKLFQTIKSEATTVRVYLYI